MSLEVCSEGFLRRAIKSGELKSCRNSPRGKILVRQSWFDEWAETQEGEEFRIHQKVQRMIHKIWKDEVELEEKVQRMVDKMLGDQAKG